MIVGEYVTRFTQLSHYAPDNVDTNEKKKDCFLNGLNDGLAYTLEARDFENFQRMVNHRGMMECKRNRSASTSRATLLGATLDLLLSSMFSIPLNHNFNRGPNQRGKAMQLCSAKWSDTLIFSRLLLLLTKACRARRPLQIPRRIQQSEGLSTMERRDTMLMCAQTASTTQSDTGNQPILQPRCQLYFCDCQAEPC
jgi:hypothetical protein